MALIRPWQRLAAVLGGTLVFGVVVYQLADRLRPEWVSGAIDGGPLAGLAEGWVVHPVYSTRFGNIGFVLLIAAVLALSELRGALADDPARADALPRGLRLGEPARRGAERDADPAPRRVADRADDLAAARPARNAASRGRLMAAILELKGISKSFGGLQVIYGLDLHVDEGEIVSVIGPNGAGKTTLFNLITGVYRPDEGSIELEGRSLVGLPPHQITRLGVARTFQTLRLFLNMTVKENVMAAAYGRTKAGVIRSMLRTPGMRREEREIDELAQEKLGFFGQRLMGYRWNQPAYSLSYANRRRLEIARATATGPRILLLDEPAAGMNPTETHEITELIGQLRTDGGYTILVIEHDMHVVEGISDRVVALDHGVKIAEGSFEAVATDPRVVEAYLGTKAAATK